MEDYGRAEGAQSQEDEWLTVRGGDMGLVDRGAARESGAGELEGVSDLDGAEGL